jgi:DNA polymerase-3 subunit beta
MHIEVLQENLIGAVHLVHKAVPSKPQLAILSGLLLHVSETGVTLAATDLFLGIRTSLQAEVKEVGSVVIPAKTFTEMISSLPAGKVELSLAKGTLTIKSAVGKATLQCFPSDEFPAFPELTGDGVTTIPLEFELAQQAVHAVGFATSLDSSRPVLTSILWHIKDEQWQVVGTDGFRLAVKTMASPLPLTQALLIPAKALQEVLRIGNQLKATQVEMLVSNELKQVLVKMAGTEIFVRLIEGEYPPYEKIIPSAFTTEVVVDAESLLSHIKRAVIFARDASNIVKFQISDQTMTISGTSSAVGQYTGELQLDTTTGPGGTIAFNAKYVLDFLNNHKPAKVWFGMSESLKPAIFRPEEDPQFIYVVMPIRVNE